MTRADALAIKHHWDESKDVTAWDGWEAFAKANPEFTRQWELFKFTAGASRRQFDAVVNKLVEQSLPQYIIPEGTTLVCTKCGRWANRWADCDTPEQCPNGVRPKQ